jgi:hypothetical protein
MPETRQHFLFLRFFFIRLDYLIAVFNYGHDLAGSARVSRAGFGVAPKRISKRFAT